MCKSFRLVSLILFLALVPSIVCAQDTSAPFANTSAEEMMDVFSNV